MIHLSEKDTDTCYSVFNISHYHMSNSLNIFSSQGLILESPVTNEINFFKKLPESTIKIVVTQLNY